jgi:hypothetical protein
MANLIAKDGAGTTQYIGATGAGTDADPLVLRRQDAGIGAPADVAATSDTGAFSLLALFKRLLSAKLPDVVSGRVPVDGNLAVYGAPTLTATTAISGPSFAVDRFTRLRIQINNGAAALTGFEISTRAHATADWQVHLNSAAHYTSPPVGSILRHCADLNGAAIDLTALPANGKAVMALDLRDFFAQEIRIRATSGSSSTVQIYWGAA